ncbi:MAG: hypothetical protein R3E09_08845 [Novosphingobium sp.]
MIGFNDLRGIVDRVDGDGDGLGQAFTRVRIGDGVIEAVFAMEVWIGRIGVGAVGVDGDRSVCGIGVLCEGERSTAGSVVVACNRTADRGVFVGRVAVVGRCKIDYRVDGDIEVRGIGTAFAVADGVGDGRNCIVQFASGVKV